ncbi:MAG: type ISP restriction/modification enzyme [Bacteroidota bacterium]
MSLFLIKKYKEEVEKLIQYGGSRNEGAISSAFQNLLNNYCKTKGLLLIPQLEVRTKDGKTIKPDGTVKDSLRLDWGYWESKDSKDELETEIQKKFEKGYPDSNILFEDSQTAVLYQNGLETGRASLKEDDEKLDGLLTKFVSYERPEVHDFREAVKQFKEDLPSILEALREEIEEVSLKNIQFQKSRDDFFELCKKSINPHITLEDIREMMIQHILTEEIFLEVFSETSFHRENNIARELQKVVDTFFTGKTKKETLGKIENYYKVIRRTATDIADHHEKQKFLKVLYENFYKVYNPKAADRLGVVYTPNEIVRFMIESTDYLLHKTFNKFLGDKDVEILDPFTGTGTYITELIDYLPKDKLKFKYQNEIHCNEVVILPYYVANLNIEYTYYQKMQQYEEFKNICFVDTLDNLGFAFTTDDQQLDAFGFASENTERIKRQNEKKISVIISNPPYNANQLNENENNKNREYPKIDKRIKDTYIKASTAQKTKMYDMYARALRWASDRLNKNGIISFISNNSFVDSKTYDGFRKEVIKEFNEIYIIDLKGNARTSGERRRREAGNVFEDQIRVGVAIYFLVRKEGKQGCDIYYNAIRDYVKSDEKKNYLVENKLADLKFTHITPDKNGNWINLTENDFESLIPIANRQTKLAKKKEQENAIFKLFSLGVVTNRDEWVYDDNKSNLSEKVQYLIEIYNKDREKLATKFSRAEIKELIDYSVKWTRAVKNDLFNNIEYKFDNRKIRNCLYRVFTKKVIYYDKNLNEMQYQTPSIFPNAKKKNLTIAINQSNKPFNLVASKYLVDLHFNGDSQCIPLYRYDESGNRYDNITDWGLEQFRTNYKDKKITKLDIFHYVYAVLHNPKYRKKYEQNLRREFPRIPLYDDFRWWAKRGAELMELHLNYESISPLRLKRVEEKIKKDKPKCLLKADKENGLIYIDENTCLTNVPPEVWQYKLGNRTAIEWVLDQYKEKKIKDPTVREKFNNYKFADYKEEVIELIKKVARVSLETMKIVNELNKSV